MAKAYSWGNLCLSDIPKSKIQTGQDGKKYLSVVIIENREPEVKEKYTKKAFIKVALRKDEQLPEGEREIFGNLGDWNEQQPAPQQQAVNAPAMPADAPTEEPKDDLPF